MRIDLTNTRQLSLRPGGGSTSMKAVIAQGPKGADGSNVLPTDEAIANAIDDPESETSSKLATSYVGTAGSPATVDETTQVLPALRLMQDVLTIGSSGDVTVTLGAPALNDIISAHTKAGSAAPKKLYPTTDYTVDGATVLVPALVAADKLLIEYPFDGDTYPDPAAAVIEAYLAFDTFERTDSASSMGNATTGQTWTPYLSSVWGLSGGKAYKVGNGTQSGANDCTTIDVGAADVTVDVLVDSLVSGIWLGIAARVVNSTSLFRVSSSGLIRRAASVPTTLSTLSQQPVIGDTVRLKMVGSELSVWLKHGSADFALIAGPVTDTYNQTATKHGLILSGDVATYGATRSGFFGVKAAS